MLKSEKFAKNFTILLSVKTLNQNVTIRVFIQEKIKKF